MTNYISKVQEQIDRLDKSYEIIDRPDKKSSQYFEEVSQLELSERKTYPLKKTTFRKIRYVQE